MFIKVSLNLIIVWPKVNPSIPHIISKDDHIDDEVNIHWMTIISEYLRCVDAHSKVVPYTRDCKLIDCHVATGRVKMDKIKIMIRCDTCNLSLLNNCIAETTTEPYSYGLFLHWCNDPDQIERRYPWHQEEVFTWLGLVGTTATGSGIWIHINYVLDHWALKIHQIHDTDLVLQNKNNSSFKIGRHCTLIMW